MPDSQQNTTSVLYLDAISSWSEADYSILNRDAIRNMGLPELKMMQHPEWIPVDAMSGFTELTIQALGAKLSALTADQVHELGELNYLSKLISLQFKRLNISKLSAAAIGYLAPPQYAGLSATQIASLDLGAILALFPHIDLVPVTALSGLPQRYVRMVNFPRAKLTPEQVSALMGMNNNFPTSQFSELNISGLSVEVIARLTLADCEGLTAKQIASLRLDQIKAIPHFELLTVNSMSGFTADNIAALPNDDLALLGASQISTLSDLGLLSRLNSTQFSVLNISLLDLTDLTTTEYEGLTEKQIASLSTIRGNILHAELIPVAAMNGFTAGIVTQLSAGALAAFTADQVHVLGEQNVLNKMIGRQFSLLNISKLSEAAIGGLTATQYAAITEKQAASLSVVQIQALSAAHIEQLSGAAMSGFKADGIAALRSDALALLSADQVSNISDLSHLSSAQFGVLNISKLSLSAMAGLTKTEYVGLTEKQFASLSPTQIQAMQHLSWLSPSFISGHGDPESKWSVEFLNSLNTDELFTLSPTLSPTDHNSLSPAQKQLLTTSAADGNVLINMISDTGLKSIMQTVAAGNTSLFSFRSIESVLTRFSDSLTGSLTAGQYTDLTSYLTTVGDILGTGSSIYSLLNAMLTGVNGASVDWTASGEETRIGHLAVGSSATQFRQLITSWLDGGNHPVSSSKDNTEGRPLFASGGPSILDINQGRIGDCYLLAALKAVVNFSPDFIKSMIVENSNKSYSVRFFNYQGVATWVTVDDNVCDVGAVSDTSKWGAIVERAYTEFKSAYLGNKNDYSSIVGDSSGIALGAIIGDDNVSGFKPSLGIDLNGITGILKNAVLHHEPAVYDSFSNTVDKLNGWQDLVANHAFAITGFDAATQEFILVNPWGNLSSIVHANETFEISMDDMQKNGGMFFYANSSDAGQLVQAMANLTAQPAASSRTSVTLPASPETRLFATSHA